MTHQRGDVLIIKEHHYELHPFFDPFRSYLDQYPNTYKFMLFNTAYAKGYKCTWEIKNNYLYLLDIEGRFEITYINQYKEEKRKLKKLLHEMQLSNTEYQQQLQQIKLNLTKIENLSVEFFFGEKEKIALWFEGFICPSITPYDDHALFEAMNNENYRIRILEGKVIRVYK